MIAGDSAAVVELQDGGVANGAVGSAQVAPELVKSPSEPELANDRQLLFARFVFSANMEITFPRLTRDLFMLEPSLSCFLLYTKSLDALSLKKENLKKNY